MDSVPIDDKIDKESVMKRTFNLNFSGYFMVRAKLIDLGTGRRKLWTRSRITLSKSIALAGRSGFGT